MAIRTIYKCAKCGAEQSTGVQFWNVGVMANEQTLPAQRTFVTDKSMQVCRPCLESLGIYVKDRPGVTPPPPPSVEDLIREVVARCVE